jgi:hypothetical protein
MGCGNSRTDKQLLSPSEFEPTTETPRDSQVDVPANTFNDKALPSLAQKSPKKSITPQTKKRAYTGESFEIPLNLTPKKRKKKRKQPPILSSSYIRKKSPAEILASIEQREERAVLNRQRVLANRKLSSVEHERHSCAVRERKKAALKSGECGSSEESVKSIRLSFGGESQSLSSCSLEVVGRAM